jgi:hypothetical protein
LRANEYNEKTPQDPQEVVFEVSTAGRSRGSAARMVAFDLQDDGLWQKPLLAIGTIISCSQVAQL